MAENLIIHTGSKEEKYRELLPQLHALVSTEAVLIANLANMAAALKQTFGFFWVGFYLVKEEELVLGPFQGPIACTRIRFGRGVCGTAWKEARTLIVPDVEQFPGHIACSSDSKSEIVVPILQQSEVIGVLDIDSDELDSFFTFLNGIQPITSNFFTAIGKATRGAVLALTRQIIFLLPLILILPMLIGIDGVMYAGPVADFAAAVLAFVMGFISLKQLRKMEAETNLLEE